MKTNVRLLKKMSEIFSQFPIHVIDYSVQSGPGNSYVSNNNGNGFSTDIQTSNGNARSIYDYGIKFTDSNFGYYVRVDSLDILHSTASCGVQISDYPGNAGNEAQVTNAYTVCMPIKLDSANVEEGLGWGSFGLTANAVQNLSGLPTEEADLEANFLFGLCSMNQDQAQGEEAYNSLIQLANLSTYGRTGLNLSYALWKQNYVEAKNALSNFLPATLEQQEWKLIREREVNQFINPVDYNTIENWDKTGLTLERSIQLQQYSIHAFNRTRPLNMEPLPALPSLIKGNRVALSEEPIVSVYPSPANSQLNVVVNCKGKTPLQIQITDVSGAVVYRESTMTASGILQISTHQFAPGFYLLKLSDAEGKFDAVKFVKQ